MFMSLYEYKQAREVCLYICVCMCVYACVYERERERERNEEFNDWFWRLSEPRMSIVQIICKPYLRTQQIANV